MKEKINISNYEAWFLDYQEGELSDAERKEVEYFLAQHPELKEELDAFENISLNDESALSFDFKDKLKRNTITQFNYQSWLVAMMEGDLTKEEILQTEKYLREHPSAKPELEIFKQTRILPDHRIVFEGKNDLKKGQRIIPFRTWTGIAAAAVIALFILFYVQNSDNGDKIQTAEIKSSSSDINTADSTDKGGNKIVQPEKQKINIENKNIFHSGNSNHYKRNEMIHQEDLNKNSNVAIVAPDTAQKNIPEIIQPEAIQSYGNGDIAEVFSGDDIKELQSLRKTEEKSKVWKIAQTGAENINSLAGNEVVQAKHSDGNEQQTFALQIGKFRIAQKKGK